MPRPALSLPALAVLAGCFPSGPDAMDPIPAALPPSSTGGSSAYVCDGTPRTPSGLAAQDDIGDLWAVVVGAREDQVVGKQHGIVDVNGDGCDDLVVTTLREGTAVFFGPLGRGTWHIDEADLWYAAAGGDVRRAGDVDGDGRDDFWVGTVLLRYDGTALQAVASFPDTQLQGATGGFDADGDGEIDALLTLDSYAVVWLVYGPLASYGTWTGDLPSRRGTIPGTAVLVGTCGSDYAAVGQWMGDMDGDGTGEILIGGCGQQGLLFRGGDLRDQVLDSDDALVDTSMMWAQNALDLDQDGVNEVLSSYVVASGSAVTTGSSLDLVSTGEERFLRPAGGDVDGDLRPDLVLNQDGVFWVVSGAWTGSLDMAALPDPGPAVSMNGGLGRELSRPYLYTAAESAGDITGDGGVDLLWKDEQGGLAPVAGELWVWASDDITVIQPAP